MRRHRAVPDPVDRDAENGWEVALPLGGPRLDGVQMAGFRDRLATGLDMRVLPQPAVVVVIGLGEAPVVVEDPSGSRPLGSFAASLSIGPARARGEGVECVEISLSPRVAYGLLGVPPRELVGTVTGLEHLWGRRANHLREQAADLTSWQERFALTGRFLAERAAEARSPFPEVAAAWETIVARRGRVRISDLAASCGWSRKRLWARFTAQIGLTPRRAAMLVRFDHAARALCAGDRPGDVAMACGYADQSHLHRDVVALAGCTPGALPRTATSAG